MKVDERNHLRVAAGLPLLNVEAEERRLAAVEQDAAFEQYFLDHRDRFSRLWENPARGWLSRAGLWAEARRQLRLEFNRWQGKPC